MAVLVVVVAGALGLLTGLGALLSGAGVLYALGIYALSTYGYAIGLLCLAWLRCRVLRLMTPAQA